MNLKKISSRSNPHLKALRRLQKTGFGAAVMVVEGNKLIGEAMTAGLRPQTVWCTEPPSFAFNCAGFLVPKAIYSSISPTKTGQPPLAVFQTPTINPIQSSTAWHGPWLLLDQIQDPGNAGTLLRAALAFGFKGVVWHQPTVFPFHHGCIRASAGAIFYLKHRLMDGTGLAECPLPLVVGDLKGTALNLFKWPPQPIIAMGNEGHGLSHEVNQNARYRVRIPVNLRTESLNVAGAGHILMYHFQAQNNPANNLAC